MLITTLKSLALTWKYRRKDDTYNARLTTIKRKISYTTTAHVVMRNILLDRSNVATRLLSEAGVAAEKKELVESSGAALSNRERSLVNLDASIFDSVTFLEDIPHEIEVCEYVLSKITRKGRVMLADYEKDRARVSAEWGIYTRARTGQFFQFLQSIRLAS